MYTLLGALGLAAAPAAAIDGAALQKDPGGFWHIVLPTEITQSMRDSVPEFTPAADSMYAESLRASYPYAEDAAPFALIADLNGDAREDVVLDGSERGARVVYLALSRGHAYRWVRAEILAPDSPGRPAYRTSGLRWNREGPPGEMWFMLFPRPDGRRDRTDAYAWSDSLGLLGRFTIRCGTQINAKE